MNNKLRIVLIPAYEPELQLIGLLENIREQGLSAIVIDDGSGVSFSKIFHQASRLATVLTHDHNRGKGCGIKTGLQYIFEHFTPPYTVVTMDADGQHQVSDALRICERAESNPNALILGSRGLKENVPLRSRFGNTVTRLVYESSTGVAVYDTQTGLRGFGSALLPILMNIEGERYEYEINVLLEFARRGIRIEEIEISTIYFANNSGSHFNTLKDSFRIYKQIIKYSASSFVSFLLDYILYSILIILTAGIGSVGLTLSNIVARIISAGVNFTINRRLVFKSKGCLWKSAVQYFFLAAVILVCNTFVLNQFVAQLGMNRFVAKIITELFFFSLSWMIQRFLIFRKREGRVEIEHN
jgi:putative flippase GtrA